MKGRKSNIDIRGQAAKRLIDESSYEQREEKKLPNKSEGLN
jgi:hypothetical protein